MTQPLIVLRRNHTLWIDYPRLFNHAEEGRIEEFLMRGFEVEEVISMEVDRLGGSALVHFHPGCKQIPKALLRLAKKYEESRMRALAPCRSPYFILQQKGSRTIYSRAPQLAMGIRAYLYRGLSMMFFGLSIVGVWAPLIPTTPFVILSSYYALRSSPELNERLLRSRLFGRLLNDWHLHRAMRRSTKTRVLVFMAVVFTATFGLSRPSGPSLPIALLISLFSFGFVLRLPTVEDDIEPPSYHPKALPKPAHPS